MSNLGHNEFEQGLASFRDMTPRLWWAIYQGSLSAGFNDHQAMALLHTYILSQNPYGIRPDDPTGPNPDTPDEPS